MTLTSGQVFHWHQHDAGWIGLIGSSAVYVEQPAQNPESLLISPGASELVSHYFSLDHCMDEIYASFPEEPAAKLALKACLGLRIIRQPLWECLATSITSAMKQVSHVRTMSLYLRDHFGEAVDGLFGMKLNAYPTPRALAELSVDQLRDVGLGWRAENLRETARRIASGEFDLEALRALDNASVHRALCTLPGVGPKVGNCVLLFGYERLDAIPIDVWIKRVLENNYFANTKRKVGMKEMQRFSEAHFGTFGGYVQQYLFHHARTRKLLERAKKH